MTTSPPLTPKDIEQIIMKALEKKGDLHIRIRMTREVKLPGATQFSSEGATFSVETDLPAGEKILTAFHKLYAELEVPIGEFKAAHLVKKPDLPKPKENETKATDEKPYYDSSPVDLAPNPKSLQRELTPPSDRGNQLDALPWKPFKEGTGWWIFKSAAPPNLVEEIQKTPGGKMSLGPYDYKISVSPRGTEFINRILRTPK